MRWLKGVAVGTALCVTGLLALDTVRRAVLPLPRDRCHLRRFDPALWQDSAQARWPAAVRGCMVDDLLRRDLLSRRTRAEVVALLGEPRRTAFFPNHDLVYWLGPERSFVGIDSEWLVLWLDAEGRVREVRLMTD